MIFLFKQPCIFFDQGTITFLRSDIVISLPTFIIAECVLIYLDPDSTQAIVGWTSQTFKTAVFFLYEQVTVFLVVSSFLFIGFVERLVFLALYDTLSTDPPR